MTHGEAIIDKGVIAALELAGETGWPAVTLAAIAQRAGLELGEFHGVADKTAIAHAVEHHFDAVMSRAQPDEQDTARERLFDVLMNRFEAMEPYRAGLVSLSQWRERHPAELARMLAERRTTARWALVSAGLDDSEGLPAGLKATNLAWVVASASRAWRKDAGPDFTRTMSTLDKQLRAAEEREGWVSRLIGGRRARGNRAETPSATPAEETGPDASPTQ